ncbi:hypothetical protein IEQ34_026977 [Dendrobium chrysotoxum]|uniref:Uncharacterized protein n=1 Tax=Dendrobium chrysotoxum TaxID=161865 RepID=A0AAV7FID3_DENCH|nr:hypothetical protein IEQ34_026977 [Dendrobium chrysotoxum]
MAISDAESCESRAFVEKPLQYQRHHSKLEVYNEVLRRLKESGSPEVLAPSFKEDLWSHFNRLPVRYALDVNVERAEDVLTHKRLLQQAQDPVIQLAFDIRPVQMPRGESYGINSQSEEDTYLSQKFNTNFQANFFKPMGILETVRSIHPPPTFGSSTNLESLVLEVNDEHVQDGGSASKVISNFSR